MEIENKIQWHPAFCAVMELELSADRARLEFDREHNLSKEPLRIDLLVIKKNSTDVIKNEIGSFFLGYNIMEYKSPDDGLNIDTLYKVLAYACLYKADTGGIDEIKDTDITITLVREGRPEKLLCQLGERYPVVKKGKGIYFIDKMLFPVQIIATGELDADSHIWLKSLTRSMDRNQAEQFLDICECLTDDVDVSNAKAMARFVSDLNNEVFDKILDGGGKMSEALKRAIESDLRELNSLKAEIADSKAALADRDAVLADRDAEIAELKRQLAEMAGAPR